MRMNWWVRAGIVLSVVWAVVAGIQTHNSNLEGAKLQAGLTYKVCANEKLLNHDRDLTTCNLKREDAEKTWMKDSNANPVVAALAPLPFFWLAGFCLLYFSRAQIVGFRAVVPWSSLSTQKKVFVVFCGIASAAAVLFAFMIVMNWYVDTLVPVVPGMKTVTISNSGELVSVIGTWTRTDLAGSDDSIADPLQTSRIECNKEDNTCIESRGYVSNNSLFADLIKYDIQSWTSSSIVLRNEASCWTEIFTIDLNTEAVSGAGHPTNQDTMFCKMGMGNDRQKWTYALTDGFGVYWQRRQAARPLPLRLIQTLFGN